MEKRIRIRDIAREAGVSETAVSFWINGRAKQYKLSASTCERIAAVVAKYNYVPNPHARALLRKRTGQIGLCLYGTLSSSFWSPIIDSIEQEIAPAGCHLLLASSHRDAEGELAALRFMRSKGVDGILLNPVRDVCWMAPNLDFYRELSRDVPLVVLNVPLPGVVSVYNDESHGGCLAAEYLLECGCRAPVVFGKGHELTGVRVRSFGERLKRSGASEVLTVHSVRECVDAVRNGSDGIFCYSDYRLIELLAGRRGVREQLNGVSLVGFDGLELLTLFQPRPATIVQHKRLLGRQAARRLLKIIGGNEEAVEQWQALRPRLLRPGGGEDPGV